MCAMPLGKSLSAKGRRSLAVGAAVAVGEAAPHEVKGTVVVVCRWSDVSAAAESVSNESENWTSSSSTSSSVLLRLRPTTLEIAIDTALNMN